MHRGTWCGSDLRRGWRPRPRRAHLGDQTIRLGCRLRAAWRHGERNAVPPGRVRLSRVEGCTPRFGFSISRGILNWVFQQERMRLSVRSALFRTGWRRGAFSQKSIGSLSDWANTQRRTATWKRTRGSVRSSFRCTAEKSFQFAYVRGCWSGVVVARHGLGDGKSNSPPHLGLPTGSSTEISKKAESKTEFTVTHEASLQTPTLHASSRKHQLHSYGADERFFTPKRGILIWALGPAQKGTSGG
jgi:hypothetical protein